MTTDAQIEANRQNAQQSTGPKTPEGKARSARNALRHGFRAKIILDRGHEFPNGEPEAFADLLESLVAELRPRGPREGLCVETYAVAHWRLQFILLEEIDSYVFCKPGSDNPAIMEPRDSVRLNALVRYEAHLDRQASRAMKDLRQLQIDRIYGGPEGAPRCNPAAEKCEVVRQIHAADKAREQAMRELDAMRRAYNPPQFNPDDFTSNEANSGPSSACPTDGRPIAAPLSETVDAATLAPCSFPPAPPARASAPNEPNSRALGFLAIRKPQSPPNKPEPRPTASRGILGFGRIGSGSCQSQSVPNKPNSCPSSARGGDSAQADLGPIGAVSTAGIAPDAFPPNEPNANSRATAGRSYGPLGFLVALAPRLSPPSPANSSSVPIEPNSPLVRYSSVDALPHPVSVAHPVTPFPHRRPSGMAPQQRLVDVAHGFSPDSLSPRSLV